MPDSLSCDRVAPRVHIIVLIIAAVSFGVVAELILILVSFADIQSILDPVRPDG